MLRIPLRVSSVLFVVTGLVTAVYGWGITHGAVRSIFPGHDDAAFFIDFTLASGVCGGIGLALLSRQAHAQRHWLGWLGIVLTLLGLAMSTLSTVAIYAQRSYSSSDNVLLLGATLATPTFALGLIFWALDLPNTSTLLLLQKAAMSTIGLLPFFELAMFQGGTLIIDSQRLAYIEALLSGGVWCLLGAIVWFYRDAPLVAPPTSLTSFADSSFDLIVTPLPPGDG